MTDQLQPGPALDATTNILALCDRLGKEARRDDAVISRADVQQLATAARALTAENERLRALHRNEDSRYMIIERAEVQRLTAEIERLRGVDQHAKAAEATAQLHTDWVPYSSKSPAACLHDHIQQLTARVAELEAALREIEKPQNLRQGKYNSAYIATTALAHTAEPEE